MISDFFAFLAILLTILFGNAKKLKVDERTADDIEANYGSARYSDHSHIAIDIMDQ